MFWQVQQSIHFRDCDLFWAIGNSYDLVARTNFSFLQHAKVKSWPSVCDKKRRHARLIHSDADAVTGHAWLCDFEYGIPNAVSITNAGFVIGKSFHSEILSELADSKIIAPKESLPVLIRLHLVDKHSALLTTVTGEIGLPITIDVQLAHHPPPLHRKLPDRCSHSPAVPCHFAWKADIQRDQSGHLVRPPRRGNRSRLINEHEGKPAFPQGLESMAVTLCLIAPRRPN